MLRSASAPSITSPITSPITSRITSRITPSPASVPAQPGSPAPHASPPGAGLDPYAPRWLTQDARGTVIDFAPRHATARDTRGADEMLDALVELLARHRNISPEHMRANAMATRVISLDESLNFSVGPNLWSQPPASSGQTFVPLGNKHLGPSGRTHFEVRGDRYDGQRLGFIAYDRKARLVFLFREQLGHDPLLRRHMEKILTDLEKNPSYQRWRSAHADAYERKRAWKPV